MRWHQHNLAPSLVRLLRLIGLTLPIIMLPVGSQSSPSGFFHASSHSHHPFLTVRDMASALHKTVLPNNLMMQSQMIKPNLLQPTSQPDHQQKASIEKILSALRARWLNNPLVPALGASPDNARVIIIEFFDYQCSYCRRIHEPLMRVVRTERDVRLLFLELPILGPASRRAARAALAAHRQNRYLPFHTALMGLQQRLNEASLKDTIKRVGLDARRLEQDKQNPEIDQHIDDILNTAYLLGIRGTPAFLFGNYFIPGGVSEKNMRSLIALARNAHHSPLPSQSMPPHP